MKPIGTFLKDGDCLTGIIHTPTTQARLTFTPEENGSGILIARIDGEPVGHAEPRHLGDGIPCYAVYLHPDILPGVRLCALVGKGCRYVLTARR